MRVRFFGILCAISCAAFGQTGSVAGPSSGYVFDLSAKVVRQIRGIPGAAMLGDALDLGIQVTGVEVSPRGDLAVATAADGSVHLFRLNNGAASEIAAQGLFRAPVSVVFSPSGTSAVLYRSGTIQILKGLPDSLDVGHPLPVPSGGSAMAAAAVSRRLNPAEFAISDDGTCLLIGRETSVALVVSGGTRVLADAHGGAMVAFAPGGHDAAVVTGGTLSIYQDVAGASTHQEFPAASASAGLAFSVDGNRVLMASPRAVTVLDRATGDQKLAECECRIGSLAPMGAMFRLNEAGSGPLWLVDPAALKLFFVPARPGV